MWKRKTKKVAEKAAEDILNKGNVVDNMTQRRKELFDMAKAGRPALMIGNDFFVRVNEKIAEDIYAAAGELTTDDEPTNEHIQTAAQSKAIDLNLAGGRRRKSRRKKRRKSRRKSRRKKRRKRTKRRRRRRR